MTPGLMILLMGLAFAMGIIFGSSLRRHRPHSRVGGEEQPDLERDRLRARDRAETRGMMERLAEKKLEVIKDAIAMGYGEAQLARLDARLERLIGPEKLQEMLNELESDPLPGADLSMDPTATRGKGEME